MKDIAESWELDGAVRAPSERKPVREGLVMKARSIFLRGGGWGNARYVLGVVVW